MFFLVFLGAVCFSFIKYMQMSHDCRVVTISTNHIMISIMTQFTFLAASEFLFTRVFVITVGLNN